MVARTIGTSAAARGGENGLGVEGYPRRAKAPKAAAYAPRARLSMRLVHDLARRIDTGQWKPGQRLPPERELMETYGVSRTVVREAASSLRASGHIATHQGRGAFVLRAAAPIRFAVEPSERATLRDVVDVIELRLALEPEAAALAAARGDAAAIGEIGAALKRLAGSTRAPDTSAPHDIDFHLAIAQATGNPYYHRILEGLAPRMLPRARLDLFGQDRRAKTAYLARLQLEHTQIFEAIRRGDADAARSAMHLHLTNSRERLRSLLGRTQGRRLSRGRGASP